MPIPRHQIPNALTILRLVLAGAFFALLNLYRFPDQNVLLANLSLVCFVLAALTDALDGHLARKWQAISTFGRIMDPFCDKVLILGAFIYLSSPRFLVPHWVVDDHLLTMATGVYPWMVVLIFARELLVTGIRGVVEGMGVEFGALWTGKIKMILQSVVIPIVLLMVINADPAGHEWVKWTCHGLIGLTVLVTVYSGVPYVQALRTLAIDSQEKDTRP